MLARTTRGNFTLMHPHRRVQRVGQRFELRGGAAKRRGALRYRNPILHFEASAPCAERDGSRLGRRGADRDCHADKPCRPPANSGNARRRARQQPRDDHQLRGRLLFNARPAPCPRWPPGKLA